MHKNKTDLFPKVNGISIPNLPKTLWAKRDKAWSAVPDSQLVKLDPRSDPLFVIDPDKDLDRHEIWWQASDEFRDVLIQIGEWFVNEFRVDVLRRYDLAELVKKVDDDMNQGGRRYGSYSMRKLHQFFGWEDGALYSVLRVARAFTRAEIEAISRMRCQDGGPICYSHLHLLSAIDDRVQRQEMLQRTLEESWTTRDLEDHIHKLPCLKPRNGNSPGRPLGKPRNLEAIVTQQERSADDFLNRSAKVWVEPEHSLATKVHLVAQCEFTEARVEQLHTLAQKLRRLAEEAGKRAEEAELAYEYAARNLQKRQPAALPAPANQNDDSDLNVTVDDSNVVP